MIKLHCSAEGRRMTSGSSYREVLKIEGLKNLDSTAHITVLCLDLRVILCFAV